MQCIYVKTDGNQCNGVAMTENEFCFSHNPNMEEEKELAVRKGGLAPKRKEEPLEPMPINNPTEVMALIQDTINRIRTSPMSPQRANSIGYLASIALKSMEIGEIDEKLQLINSLILERKVRIK